MKDIDIGIQYTNECLQSVEGNRSTHFLAFKLWSKNPHMQSTDIDIHSVNPQDLIQSRTLRIIASRDSILIGIALEGRGESYIYRALRLHLHGTKIQEKSTLKKLILINVTDALVEENGVKLKFEF